MERLLCLFIIQLNYATLILKIWISILNLGVSDKHPDENELIRLYNGMSFLSATGTVPVMLFAWYVDFVTVYFYITIPIFCLYVSILTLNAFGKITLARYFISIGSPIWIGGSNLLAGGYFCQGLGITASLAITYVVFQKKPKTRIALFILHLILYFFSSIYITLYQPILGVIDFPYDEFMVFIAGLGWTSMVLYKFNKDQAMLVKDLKINNQDLKNTTEELERFTYIASHDLKSPLRTIISFIGLIERDVKREKYDNVLNNLNFVKTGAKQMNFLVQDILEFSTLNKHDKTTYTLIDFNRVFEKAQHNLIGEIQEKKAIIHCEPLPHFNCNELDFLLLFQNFIQNGIKYNESEQPTISISSVETPDTLSLIFKDNGIGIEEQYHEQIFQFFKRLHTADKYQGTGLGLGVCKKIITSYDGDVTIDSQIGKGTTFTIIFPIDQTITSATEVLEEVNM